MRFLQKEWLQLGPYTLSYGALALALGLLVLFIALDFFLLARFLPRLLRTFHADQRPRIALSRRIQPLIIFGMAWSWVVATGVNPTWYANPSHWLGASTLIQGLIIWQLARVADLLIGGIIVRDFFQEQRKIGRSLLVGGPQGLQRDWEVSNRYIQYVVYLMAVFFLLRNFHWDFELFRGRFGKTTYIIHASNLLIAGLVVLLARLINWLAVHLFLANFYRRRKLNIGSQYAINQLVIYLIYFVTGLLALNLLGVNITVIAGGAVALLVGVGIGLQQTFNDFFSGLILLFERSVEVGDVVEIESLVGKVRRIGLRTSIIQTRDNRSVIVPNSKLVVDNVTNWSHGDDVARFSVAVGVAYGSDVELVKKLLIKAAQTHPKVLAQPETFVRFADFGNSALQFEVHFWSEEFMQIPDVQSDIRLQIDALFRAHQIAIPFPQQDLWIRQWPPTNP